MKKFKRIISLTAAVILIAVFSLCSKTVLESVSYSLRLCYSSVIPSLFPFFILCEFLMSAVSGIGINCAITAFATGLVTGFPTGVNNVCKLYSDGSISKGTAVSLLHCTANASPAYIVAFIGICIIRSKSAGILLLISQILCAFACAIFFGCFKKRDNCKTKISVLNVTEIACESISHSVISCLYVCGYIIFFGIIADIAIKAGLADFAAKILFFLPRTQAGALFVGFIEITRGIYMLDFNESGAIVIAAIIVAFSGISVIMQCISCTIKAGLPKRPVITGKIVYAVIMPIISGCLSEMININAGGSAKSDMPVISFLLFIIFFVACVFFIYNIFDKSSKRLYNK